MPQLLEEIRELKIRAKNRRDVERYDTAVTFLQRAIDLAEVELAKSAEGDWQRQMASELADCYGLLGGVQRRWALDPKSPTERVHHLRESVSSYDKGYSFESNAKFALPNSYNMVNRLTSRILYYKRVSSEPNDPEVSPVDMAEELEKARKSIHDQVTGPRRGDVWALADLAMVELLLGMSEPAAAYASFNILSPPDYAYTSVLAGLQPLAELDLPIAGKLKEAVALLEQRLARLSAA